MKTLIIAALLAVTPVSADEWEISPGYIPSTSPQIIRQDGDTIEVFENNYDYKPTTTYRKNWRGDIEVFTGDRVHMGLPDYTIRKR